MLTIITFTRVTQSRYGQKDAQTVLGSLWIVLEGHTRGAYKGRPILRVVRGTEWAIIIRTRLARPGRLPGCVQDCVGERQRWSRWGTLEIHEHVHVHALGL